MYGTNPFAPNLKCDELLQNAVAIETMCSMSFDCPEVYLNVYGQSSVLETPDIVSRENHNMQSEYPHQKKTRRLVKHGA